LRNANLELSLERSKHSVEVVVKDEDIRKLRVAQCLLQDDNSDLHEQLEEEQARSDELENALDEALTQLDEQQAEGEAAQNTIRTQAREVANLKVGAFLSSIKALLTLTRPNCGLWKT
jgi:predicted RNase H-like nuclease (RuvC/YqgF family)